MSFVKDSRKGATADGVANHRMTGFDSASEDNRRLFENARRKSDEFKNKHGRRPRILIACTGRKNAESDVKRLASAYADFGFDVDISLSSQPFQHVARMAVENDVHAVGIAVMAVEEIHGLVSGLLDALQKADGEEIMLIAHGGFSSEIRNELLDSGVDYIVDTDAMGAGFALELLDDITDLQPKP